MKLLISLLLLCSLGKFAFTQNVTILEKGIKLPSCNDCPFEMIQNGLDYSRFEKVAQLEGKFIKAEEGSIEKLFSTFRYKSNKMGANAYRFDTIIDNKAVITLHLSIYCLQDSILKKNNSYRNKNEVYLFGPLDKTKNTVIAKINNENSSFEPLHFKKYKLKNKEKISLKVGKLFGNNHTLIGSENANSVYCKLGKFTGRVTNNYAPNKNTIGIRIGEMGYNGSAYGFNSGDISQIEDDLGLFLSNILTEN